ncbi:phosphoglucosamine mutase [Niveispirillum sp. SYP-B3756]|uniref:phosphoglucosamine mutase n=1 Tax=Niveispirillum sp. SYP-B3756 TaxID=2662178 RepID=UPI0012925FE8|nr:phosphoglucosamine mutase [Niveispirillum sp. SYP-B3756]MQP65413.1 phosphoglucosamine mutase [Niveispirillum sp. SYP-B3756]
MSRKLFGTDGIRGTANTEPMTAETALKAAMAAALQFRRGDHRHTVVIAKDTRLSGYMLEPALTAGFISMGMDVILVGPLPTPAVAMLTRSMRADLGVMLSASHNPYHDNGIKLFGPDGYKLSDEIERGMEERMAQPFAVDLVNPRDLGRAQRMEDASGRYIEVVKSSFPRGLRLDGMKIVLDCAHGAAYKVAPRVLYELGAEVVTLFNQPNGFNINDKCGATAPAAMRAAVLEHQADIGIALDGDADRLILADENGSQIDGDQIMALIGASWAESGRLRGGGVVATVMSNMGMELYLKGLGLSLARTAVGDRYVVEHMREHGFNVGGEQSGHVVLSDFATTGDGLLAALQVLACVRKAGRPASDVLRVFQPLPQLLKNVRYEAGGGVQPLEDVQVKAAIAEGEARLADRGRVLIRKSGTEPLIRVMAEGEDEGLVKHVVDDICAAVQSAAAKVAAE